MVKDQEDDLAATFGALADPTRRRVVELLGDGPKRAGDLATETAMSNSAMSRHLKVLLSAGLAEASVSPDDARVRLFRLSGDHLTTIGEWLDYRSRWTRLQESMTDATLTEHLVEFGRVFTEAVSAGDAEFLDKNLTDDALLVFGPGRYTKAETVASIGSGHEPYVDMEWHDPHLIRMGSDSAALSVRVTGEVRGERFQRFDSSVFHLVSGAWQLALHQSTDIV